MYCKKVGHHGWPIKERQSQKTNQKEFRIEKVIKKKGDKLYVKWKSYDNSFNSQDR